jgi:DNA-binding MarR family transcriptional regulator
VSISSEDKRIKNYMLTDKSRDIYAIVLMITSWGDRWLAGSEGPPQFFIHKPCGNYAAYQMVCGYCNDRIAAGDISQVPWA